MHIWKILLLTIIILFVSGCSHQEMMVVEKNNSYINEHLGVYFNYPIDWEVIDSESHSKVIVLSPGHGTRVVIPSESFEEFENRNSEYIRINYITKVSDDRKYPTGGSKKHLVEGYVGHEGWHYIIKIDDDYINITTEEFDLWNEEYDEQKEIFRDKLDMILDSLSF